MQQAKQVVHYNLISRRYIQSPENLRFRVFRASLTLNSIRDYAPYDLFTGQLAGPIDLLTKRRQAEIHAGAASVEQDAGHGEFS